MNKFKKIAGLIWAFAAVILIIILFPFMSDFSESLAQLPFMKINPNYTGGEVAFETISTGRSLVVRKPVFDGLFKERDNGFVQVEWHGNIPGEIIDTIDYNIDSMPDFSIKIDTRSAVTDINRLTGEVRDINISTSASYGWVVRVNLERE